MLTFCDVSEIKFHYYRTVLEWIELLNEEFEGLLWVIHGANIINGEVNTLYGPLILHLRELAYSYGIKDIPPGFEMLPYTGTRPYPDKIDGRLKQVVLDDIRQEKSQSLYRDFGYIARVLEKEIIPSIEVMWTPDSLYRAPGVSLLGEFSYTPITEFLWDKPTMIMNTPFVHDQCVSRVLNDQSALLGLQKFLAYFRTSLDTCNFTKFDLIQFCLVADLLYLMVEFRKVGEKKPDVIRPILVQMDELLSLVTIGVFNVVC